MVHKKALAALQHIKTINESLDLPLLLGVIHGRSNNS
jgi:hypothetical protein